MAGAVRVVLDGYQLTDGSEQRGIGTVLRHVLPGLAGDDRLAVSVLARPAARVPDGVERIHLARHDLRPRLAHLEHELRLPADLRRARAEVILSPGNLPPRHSPAPLVQILYDLTPLVWPHPLSENEARRWRRAAAQLRRARMVVAISRSAADQGIAHLDLDPDRVEVVHLGADPTFAPGPRPDGAGPPHLLYVGAWGPHKGYAEAMAVVAAVADAGHPHRLRIVGPADAWMAERVAEVRAAAPRPDLVDVVGWVPDVVAAYRSADALLFTSRAEGFGLPLLEALACGLPVVAFANTSIPEVVGDAALLVPDGDVAAATAAVHRVLSEPTLARELAGGGPTRAATFRWADAVGAYADILMGAADR